MDRIHGWDVCRLMKKVEDMTKEELIELVENYRMAAEVCSQMLSKLIGSFAENEEHANACSGWLESVHDNLN